MKLTIDIPEKIYLNAKEDLLCGENILVKAIKNGTPHETITEFADRCRECGREKVLDKIRAEILEEKECAYADFERYKVEYLGQDWEDVLDSLPQDDFRYGMERALEIIRKHIAESEG